jgi:hypothetical protein
VLTTSRTCLMARTSAAEFVSLADKLRAMSLM